MHTVQSILFISIILFITGCNEKNEPSLSSIKSQEETTIQKEKDTKKKQTIEISGFEEHSLEGSLEQSSNGTKPITQKQHDNSEQLVSLIKKEQTPKYYPKQVIKRESQTVTKNDPDKFDFNIIKKGHESDNTLLIVGGIQGDEPGGFMAASLVATHYNIKKGAVWIVPNLNFYSIIKRSRGPYGDMNRKFATISKNDPDYKTVTRIKNYIKDDKVKMIINLHDGSGYYRPQYEDKLHSPYRWGQCSIIDQASLDVPYYGDLYNISDKIVKHINKNLIRKEHRYHLHNTRTSEGDKEMEKTLTYYAINQGKAAFGNEASKSLPTHQRTYYHLLALEKYMEIMGIEFERKFNMNDQVIKNIIDNDVEISLYNGKINLPLSQVRSFLNYFPVNTNGTINFTPSNPLISIVKKHDEYIIYYGNRRLSTLSPDYIPLEPEKTTVKFTVDSTIQDLELGSVIDVKDNFLVHPIKDYRINVIGFTNGKQDETNVTIDRSKLIKRFSIDKVGSTYRVEYYKNKKFAGMVLVRFTS